MYPALFRVLKNNVGRCAEIHWGGNRVTPGKILDVEGETPDDAVVLMEILSGERRITRDVAYVPFGEINGVIITEEMKEKKAAG